VISDPRTFSEAIVGVGAQIDHVRVEEWEAAGKERFEPPGVRSISRIPPSEGLKDAMARKLV
jgi:hypothetical protein